MPEGSTGRNSRLTLGEDLGHMFVQPVQFMADRVFHFLQLLLNQLCHIFFLCDDPCGRADGPLSPRASGGHCKQHGAGSGVNEVNFRDAEKE